MREAISVTYKFIDGAHFFVSSDKKAEGLCVAHSDLKVAFEEVSLQLKALFEFNHGLKMDFQPGISFEPFKQSTDALRLVVKGADPTGRMTAASVQPWMYDKPGARQ